MRTILYVLQLALGIVIPLAMQRWDRRHLTPEQRARAWNTASWGAALYAFGPLSMLGWWWVTRRSFAGILVGLVIAVDMVLLIGWVTQLTAEALGLPA